MLAIIITLYTMAFQGYETQAYEVVDQLDAIEIRYYPPAMKVKVESSLSENRNFNALFRYISGNNASNQKIAMTTPVYMHNTPQGQTMEFVLPSRFKDEAPEPKGVGVEVYQSKAGHFAAIRYGGYSNSDKVKHYTGALLKALKEAGKKVTSAAIVLSYDAPYKFYNRRNEILFEIDY